VARTIFLSEIILQTSCNRIRAEMFVERFPDNRTHDDILIGYHALPKTIRIARAILDVLRFDRSKRDDIRNLRQLKGHLTHKISSC